MSSFPNPPVPTCQLGSTALEPFGSMLLCAKLAALRAKSSNDFRILFFCKLGDVIVFRAGPDIRIGSGW